MPPAAGPLNVALLEVVEVDDPDADEVEVRLTCGPMDVAPHEAALAVVIPPLFIHLFYFLFCRTLAFSLSLEPPSPRRLQWDRLLLPAAGRYTARGR